MVADTREGGHNDLRQRRTRPSFTAAAAAQNSRHGFGVSVRQYVQRMAVVDTEQVGHILEQQRGWAARTCTAHDLEEEVATCVGQPLVRAGA
jgi:hypothetical protein